jgi:hypothetical protein
MPLDAGTGPRPDSRRCEASALTEHSGPRIAVGPALQAPRPVPHTIAAPGKGYVML